MSKLFDINFVELTDTVFKSYKETNKTEKQNNREIKFE